MERTIVHGWIARDSNNTLWLFERKPYKVKLIHKEGTYWTVTPPSELCRLPNEAFSSQLPEDEPRRVSITITLEQ